MSWLNEKHKINVNDEVTNSPTWRDIIDIYNGNHGNHATENDLRNFFHEQLKSMVADAEENFELVLPQLLNEINL